MSIAKIKDKTFATSISEEQIKEIVVGQPSFMEGVDKIIADMTPGQLKSYMEWDVINSSSSLLSSLLLSISA